MLWQVRSGLISIVWNSSIEYFTCNELVMLKIYWNAIVSVLKLRIPNTHVTPRIGRRIREERNPVLMKRRKQCYWREKKDLGQKIWIKIAFNLLDVIHDTSTICKHNNLVYNQDQNDHVYLQIIIQWIYIKYMCFSHGNATWLEITYHYNTQYGNNERPHWISFSRKPTTKWNTEKHLISSY